jgi:hypothetical protein
MVTRGFVKGLGLLPFALVMGRHATMTSLQGMARGLGYVAGRMGYRLDEYRRIHGR